MIQILRAVGNPVALTLAAVLAACVLAVFLLELRQTPRRTVLLAARTGQSEPSLLPLVDTLNGVAGGQELTAFFRAWFHEAGAPADEYLWPGPLRP